MSRLSSTLLFDTNKDPTLGTETVPLGYILKILLFKELLKFKLLSSRASIVMGIFPEPVNSILGYKTVPVSGKIPICLSLLAIIIAPE
jgi:hypothetical protein